MIISDQKTIKEIQTEFNNKFPFLKIEFYKMTHKTNEGSPDISRWDFNKTIGEIRTIQTSGDLSINGNQKVSTLEKNFEELYGLNVQVFHKSGNLWLQTTATDEWTLSHQNEKAESFAIFQASK